MLGREEILNRIRSARRESPRSDSETGAPGERIPTRSAGVPVHPDELLARFLSKAAANNFTVERIGALQDLVPAVRAFLTESDEPDISVAGAFDHVDWPASWKINRRAGRFVEHLSVTQAVAGIAETGSVVLTSGPRNPTSLSFLPDVNVIVLRAADIVARPEDVWQHIGIDALPRTVNVISGPSRTADVGGIIVRPAHGPKRVHIAVLVS